MSKKQNCPKVEVRYEGILARLGSGSSFWFEGQTSARDATSAGRLGPREAFLSLSLVVRCDISLEYIQPLGEYGRPDSTSVSTREMDSMFT